MFVSGCFDGQEPCAGIPRAGREVGAGGRHRAMTERGLDQLNRCVLSRACEA
jgi:hypothetical protein